MRIAIIDNTANKVINVEVWDEVPTIEGMICIESRYCKSRG